MQELPTSYDPKSIEARCSQLWEEKRAFVANSASTKPHYCIVIPPPNVTGKLHMGHALVNTLQDILIRFKRMDGYEVLWVPGTDHAGISTQTTVEKHLIATCGKQRRDFSPKEFLKEVWKFKEESEKAILGQLKRLGSSCDWTRLRFTMDERNNRSVKVAFKRLFDRGLIYRGDYLVNWDPLTGTALADDEVEYEERQTALVWIRYPLVGSKEHICVATTRPETLFGDVAVAVHPSDKRYAHLVGQYVYLPLTDRQIPIIADRQIDPEFGSGALKVTPGHDPKDWQIGQLHQLPVISVLTAEGRLNEKAGVFVGLTVKEARHAVITALKEEGLLEKEIPHLHRVGVSYRSKAVIEPMVSKQWFLKMSLFAPQLRAAVESSQVELIPEQWRQTYFHWIDHLRDWCISRQLWWGHRIPVWYHKNDKERFIVCDSEELPPEVQAAPEEWVQEEDVLDTWFSSALWPFATLGWPEETADLKAFYPNAILITGHDILFFWVARMLLMGHLLTEQWPFPKVFLHGLIYGKSYWRELPDGGIQYCMGQERQKYEKGAAVPAGLFSKWEKMSKSKGNIIDPLEMIESYGTDAVRMTLTSLATQARQIDLDERRFEEYKNFANKLWNAFRFVWIHIQEMQPFSHALQVEDLWILSRLESCVKEVRANLENLHFDRYATGVYRFLWDEFCAYYVELAKPALIGKRTEQERGVKQWVLSYVLLQTIRLLHPVVPFITEELFGILKGKFLGIEKSGCPYLSDFVDAIHAPSCSQAPFPRPLPLSEETASAITEFELMQEVVYALRLLRTEGKIPIQEGLKVMLVTQEGARFEKLLPLIKSLVRCSELVIAVKEPLEAQWLKQHLPKVTVAVEAPQPSKEHQEKLLKKNQELIERLERQLSNEEFVKKAPRAIVEQMRQQLHEAHKYCKGE